MLGPSSVKLPRSAPLVAALTIAFLAAIAVALPDPPIPVPSIDAERGLLVRHSQLSAAIAEQAARHGYTYLAVDVTTARFGDEEFWTGHMKDIAGRQCPVWAWVDLARFGKRGDGLEHARTALRSLSLAGLFVAGPGAPEAAEALRGRQRHLRILPVLAHGERMPAEGRCAVVTDDPARMKEIAASGHVPVLLATRLEPGRVADVRDAAEGDYLVAEIPVR